MTLIVALIGFSIFLILNTLLFGILDYLIARDFAVSNEFFIHQGELYRVTKVKKGYIDV